MLFLLLLALNLFPSLLTKRLSPCSCLFDGKFYNLRPLASTDPDEPALEYTINGYVYGYNPCLPFNKGNCKNVAICRWNEANPKESRSLGPQTNVTCFNNNGVVELIYQQPPPDPESKVWITRVQLKCNRDMENAKLTLPSGDVAIPTLQVEHKCSCPDACYDLEPLPTSDPSDEDAIIAGSVGGGLVFVAILGCLIYKRQRKLNRQRLVRRNAQGYQAIGDQEKGVVFQGDDRGVDPRGVGADQRDGGGGAIPRDSDADPRDDDGNPRDGDTDVIGGGRGDLEARGSPPIADFPNLPVEEQNLPADDELGGQSDLVPVQVQDDPERQCCSDDEGLLVPQSTPVEHNDETAKCN